MGNMLGGKACSIVYLWKNSFLCLQFMSCNSNATSSSGKRITEVLAFFFPMFISSMVCSSLGRRMEDAAIPKFLIISTSGPLFLLP